VSKIAFCFPGQGSIEAGMGKDIADAVPAARSVFERSSAASGLDLERLCFHGAAEELVDTAVQQPALVATSLAVLAAIRDRGIEPDFVVGHSVGEFAALAAADALSLEDAITLVRERGMAMAEAALQHPGSMAAILGLEDEVVETLCRQILGVWPANYNCPGQIVVSGEHLAVDECIERAQEEGARRVVKLKVSGAFHSPAMKAVAPKLAEAIRGTPFKELKYPVIANVDAQVHTNSSDFVTLLEKQVHSPVQWVASVRRAAGEGATTFIEFGAGNVLTGLVKRILPDARTANVSDPATLKEALDLVRQDPHREPG